MLLASPSSTITFTGTDEELKKLTNDGLIEYIATLHSSYMSVVNENKSLKQSLLDLNDRFLKLEATVNELTKKKDGDENDLKRSIYELQKQSHSNSQYSRRDSLEFVGIEESVSKEKLEEKIIDICGDIGVEILPSEIQACHRLYDGKRTIVKFVSRKTVFKVLTKRSQLASIDQYKKKLYINESLCPYYRYLHGVCKSLWIERKIFGFWVSNGKLLYREREHGKPTLPSSGKKP